MKVPVPVEVHTDAVLLSGIHGPGRAAEWGPVFTPQAVLVVEVVDFPICNVTS